MRLWHVLVLLFVAAAFTVGLVLVLTADREEFPPGTQQLPYKFTIAADPGVDTGRDIFRLGQVTPGGSAWRSLTVSPTVLSVTQEEQLHRSFVVTARGPGSAWLDIEPTLLTVPGDVNITLRAPIDAPYGEYEGMLYVVPYLPK